MHPRVLASLLLASLASLSCKTGDHGAPADSPAPSASSAAVVTSSSPSPSVSTTHQAPRKGDGRLPFEYPESTTTAKKGDVALAPPRQWIDNAIQHGLDKQPFVYFRVKVLETGKQGTLIETPSGRQEEIPNPLLIPIQKDSQASPGQVVLTSWNDGTGLQRAMVVEGGEPKKPRVHYLDLRYQHPSGLGKGADTLDPNSFHVLSKPGEVGTTAACRDGERRRAYIIVHVSPKRMIGLGFAGRLRTLDPKDCQMLPITPKIEDKPLYVPVMGVFERARVRHYEQELGRIFVRFRSGGEDQEDVFGILNVTHELEE